MNGFDTAFVFASDLHLRPQTWLQHPRLRNDAYVSLNAIAQYCFSQRLPLVLGGDIFDSNRPDSESVNNLNIAARRLQSVGLYFIQGNHDKCPFVPWATIGTGATWIDRTTVTIAGIDVFGLDWLSASRLRDALPSITSASVLVCHQAWREVQGVGATDATLDDIPPHVSVLLTGHNHVTSTSRFTRSDGSELLVVSPGSTYVNRINEAADKYFFVIGLRDGRFDCIQLKLPTRIVVDVQLRSKQELDAFITSTIFDDATAASESLHESIRLPIYRLSFNSDIPEAFESLQRAIGDRGYLFPRPIQTTKEIVTDLDDSPASFETLIDAVRRMADDDLVVSDASRLFQSSDRVAELAVMEREHMERTVNAGALIEAMRCK